MRTRPIPGVSALRLACAFGIAAGSMGPSLRPHSSAHSASAWLPPAARAADPEFGSYWYDGKAELDGYDLRVSRYGQTRRGRAVMIYVTEPFSDSKRVKVDDPSADPEDTFTVLKLNLVRDFQTGIYDYNTMVSVFSRVDDLKPVKISFSSAEWCGHVYEELLFHPDGIRGHYDSYFEDESGKRDLAMKKNGVAEDNLFILLRGLRGDFLGPGEQKEIALLPGVFYGRLSHHDPGWVKAKIGRDDEEPMIEVPAGRFDTIVYRVLIDDGRQGTFHVEKPYPHRIVRWSLPPDVEGNLTGTTRDAYWRMNANGGEAALKELGVRPTVE
jgi:hypothetical protein